MDARAWRVTLAAAALMALIVGGRSSFGLFVSPLNSASGLGLANLSLALALGQLAIGPAQPVVGAWSWTCPHRTDGRRLILKRAG
jgi:hypothetical protein